MSVLHTVFGFAICFAVAWAFIKAIRLADKADEEDRNGKI